MYRKLNDFLEAWQTEAVTTQKVLDALTDASLAQAVTDQHRTLGRIAWHIVTTIPEMMGSTGLKLEEMLNPDNPVPATAGEIAGAYRGIAASLGHVIKAEWNDESLDVEDDMYGEKWPRRFTLTALVQHQIHHRGQMTVLMRQAGLKVPSIYGPAMEDWSEFGMEAPSV